MRVGVIAYPLDRPVAGGIERYVHRLAGEFAGGPDAGSFVWIHGRPFPPGHPLQGSNEVILPETGLMAAFSRRRWGRANPERLDVLWGPYFGILPGPFAKVITVHDLFALTGRDGGWLQTARFRTVTRRMVRESDWVVADSQATRAQVTELLGVEVSRVPVVHLAADPPRRRETSREQDREALRTLYGWPGDARVVLFVSTLVQRKDPVTLALAFAKLSESLPEARLLFFGHPAGASGALQRALAAADLAGTGKVAFTRSFGDEALEAAYAGADVLSLPSLFEGFGIPALEAMARGVPAVLSRGGSLPEIAGDAALYHGVQDHASLAVQLERVLRDPSLARGMAERGRKRAGEFSWERTARETWAVLRQAAGERSSTG